MCILLLRYCKQSLMVCECIQMILLISTDIVGDNHAPMLFNMTPNSKLFGTRGDKLILTCRTNKLNRQQPTLYILDHTNVKREVTESQDVKLERSM